MRIICLNHYINVSLQLFALLLACRLETSSRKQVLCSMVRLVVFLMYLMRMYFSISQVKKRKAANQMGDLLASSHKKQPAYHDRVIDLTEGVYYHIGPLQFLCSISACRA